MINTLRFIKKSYILGFNKKVPEPMITDRINKRIMSAKDAAISESENII